jgi:acyl dehydratase
MTVWHEPIAGFQYQTHVIETSTQTQTERLEACGVDPSVFGDDVDPAFYIGLAIHAGIDSGISAEGNINMLQRLIQHRPAKLDEALTVKGEITAVTQVPRGIRVDTDVWFEDETGARVISCPRTSLRPQANQGASNGPGAGQRPENVITDVSALARLDIYQLTPERVKAYSIEGNSIHYEQEAAEKAGFRAPLIGGGMGVHYLTAQMWQDRRPHAFDTAIYFRRPIFWDEAVQVGVIETPDQWQAMGLLKLPMNDEGEGGLTKVGTEMAISDYQPA